MQQIELNGAVATPTTERYNDETTLHIPNQTILA